MFPNALPRALEGFDILQRLGAGGVGEVFLARSRAGKLVAIKTIAEHRNGSADSRESFAREAAVCVRLRHPCIVQVRALLEEPGFAALVFEYVPGVTLGRVLRLGERHGVRLPDGAAWYVVERVLTALAYAHDFRDDGQGPTPIVHRDVSPSNVLLDWDGGVKIADFGLAKVLGVSSGTRLGIIKGTLGCMAPEQARGEAVDERADVYAAALLAWRLATGRSPFGKHQKDEYELLRAMRNPRIKPLHFIRPDLPESLLLGVARALAPERDQRTIAAAELAAIVRAALDVSAGQRELRDLLGTWKLVLEKTVKRAPGPESADSSGARAEYTLRYEEVALAFDEEVNGDSPTFEAHALPSDPLLVAALPRAEEDQGDSGASEPHTAVEHSVGEVAAPAPTSYLSDESSGSPTVGVKDVDRELPFEPPLRAAETPQPDVASPRGRAQGVEASAPPFGPALVSPSPARGVGVWTRARALVAIVLWVALALVAVLLATGVLSAQ